MAQSNIDLFDDYVAKIFSKLYENFPKPIYLSPDELTEKEEDRVFCRCTLEWLEEAGYIWCPTKIDMGVDAVLSSKGLEALKAIPESLEGKHSIGEGLVNSVKEGAKETAKILVKEGLSIGAKLLLT